MREPYVEICLTREVHMKATTLICCILAIALLGLSCTLEAALGYN